jgi:excisionase family DNA binding protein
MPKTTHGKQTKRRMNAETLPIAPGQLFVSPRQAGVRLGVSEPQIYLLIRKGKLPAVRISPCCMRLEVTKLDAIARGEVLTSA